MLADRNAESAQRAVDFLQSQLDLGSGDGAPLPISPGQLMDGVEHNCAAVAQEYASYLQGRQQGRDRQYFQSKAHALYFLQCVAPTKQVDRAWLNGVLKHWRDYRYDGPLITGQEELGDGDLAQNHVAIDQHMFAEQGCDGDFKWQDHGRGVRGGRVAGIATGGNHRRGKRPLVQHRTLVHLGPLAVGAFCAPHRKC